MEFKSYSYGNHMTDWDLFMGPYRGEMGSLRPERENTPWAHPGWLSWNQHAMEKQVVDFLSSFVRELSDHHQGMIVLETGSGSGYATVPMAKSLGRKDRMWCFESDDEWRRHILDAGFFQEQLNACLRGKPTPDAGEIATADLVVLDSNDPWRMAELCLWMAAAKTNCYLFLHDAGNGHPSWDGHYTLGQLVRSLKVPGKWLENPRGAFLAKKGQIKVDEWAERLWTRTLEHVYAFEHE